MDEEDAGGVSRPAIRELSRSTHRGVALPEFSSHTGGSLGAVGRWARVGDRLPTALTFVGVLAAYLAVTRGEIYAYDAQAMMAVTRNLVDHGSLTTGGFHDPFGISTPYAPYGIALSILAVPPYALSKLVGHEGTLVSLVNPLLLASATVVVFRIGRTLKWPSRYSFAAGATFGILTMALQATTEFFSEPGVTLCALLIALGIVRWGQGSRSGALLIGLGAAAAIQFREDSLVTGWAGLLAIPMFVSWQELFRPRALVALGVPIGASLGLLAWYNHLRWGTLFEAPYGNGDFSTPLGTGLHGLLLSPGKGLFVFNPLTLLGVVGLLAMLRGNRAVAVLFLLLVVPRVIFFSKWSSWEGGWSWGPRFLLPVVPFLVLAGVDLLRVTERRSIVGVLIRASAAVLVASSLVISFISIRVPYEQWYSVLATPTARAQIGDDGSLGPPVPVGSSAYMDAYEFDVTAGPLRGDPLLLSRGLAQMAPRWWRDGHSPLVGEGFIACSCLSLGLAGFLICRARDYEAVAEPP